MTFGTDLVVNSKSSLSRKRKQHDDMETRIYKPTGPRRSPHTANGPLPASNSSSASLNVNNSLSASFTTSASCSSNRIKKSKTPIIKGESLPINRIIEILDQNQMQSLLLNLVQIHPEISESVQKLAPKPQLNDSFNLIKTKYDEIFKHFPYKCEIESDYSYLRIKPYLTEFFHCLSDFILNHLPPVENSQSNSIKFLDYITNLIHELPNFSNQEFQYTRLMAYEQVVNCWLIVLSSGNEEDASTTNSQGSQSTTEYPLITIIQELDLRKKVQHHNLVSQGKFKPVVSFIEQELENYEKVNHLSSGNSINDLITVDYSNYSITTHTSH